MTLDQQFNRLTDKIQHLLKAQARLHREGAQLRQKLAEEIKKREAAEAEVQVLKQQSSILKLASGDVPEKEKKAFERSINNYIKDIDRCIAYLNK